MTLFCFHTKEYPHVYEHFSFDYGGIHFNSSHNLENIGKRDMTHEPLIFTDVLIIHQLIEEDFSHDYRHSHLQIRFTFFPVS